MAEAKQTRIKRANATNEKRVHESLEFINSLKMKMKAVVSSHITRKKETELQKSTEKRSRMIVKQKKQLFVSVTVITSSRKQVHGSYDPRYLTQVSSQLLKLMELEEKQKTNTHDSVQYKLFLCNVDQKPLNHEEVNSLMELITTFASEKRFVLSSYSDLFEKEKEDYVFCLKKTLLFELSPGIRPDYVVLIEDDAYPSTNLFPVLTYILHSHMETRNRANFITKNKESIAYVKLYHPRRLQSFISLEPDRLPELLGISMLFGTLLTGLYAYIKPKIYFSISKGSVNLCFVLFVIYSGMLAFCIGRQNIMAFRQLSKHLYAFVPAPHCCTPAMLFPSGNAWHLIDKLAHVKCRAGYGKDTALFDIMRDSNMSAFMVSPSLFEHIGMYSMLRRGKLVDPDILP